MLGKDAALAKSTVLVVPAFKATFSMRTRPQFVCRHCGLLPIAGRLVA
jgi:hypothetical protein